MILQGYEKSKRIASNLFEYLKREASESDEVRSTFSRMTIRRGFNLFDTAIRLRSTIPKLKSKERGIPGRMVGRRTRAMAWQVGAVFIPNSLRRPAPTHAIARSARLSINTPEQPNITRVTIITLLVSHSRWEEPDPATPGALLDPSQ
jgi:hypothetical protein